jgi:hypothetical protein
MPQSNALTRRFRPEDSFVLAQPPSTLQRLLAYLISISVISGIILSFFLRFPTHINSSGELEPVTLPHVLLSPGRHMVKSRAVDPGQAVDKGALLFELLSKNSGTGPLHISAPIKGVVYALSGSLVPGNTVTRGEELARIFHSSDPLGCILQAPSRDREFLYKGLDVDIEIDGYTREKHGISKGKVQSIFYRAQSPGYVFVRVELKDPYLQKENLRTPLYPGLPVKARIQGPEKSLFELLFSVSNPNSPERDKARG